MTFGDVTFSNFCLSMVYWGFPFDPWLTVKCVGCVYLQFYPMSSVKPRLIVQTLGWSSGDNSYLSNSKFHFMWEKSPFKVNKVTSSFIHSLSFPYFNDRREVTTTITDTDGPKRSVFTNGACDKVKVCQGPLHLRLSFTSFRTV